MRGKTGPETQPLRPELQPEDRLGGRPVQRNGVITDNGNVILDVHDLAISQPEQLEQQINNIVGVVTNGIFARRAANMVLVGSVEGTKVIR